ncbi:MAG: hypothetical protein Kow001_11090 [Acidobacteriota bacterium]
MPFTGALLLLLYGLPILVQEGPVQPDRPSFSPGGGTPQVTLLHSASTDRIRFVRNAPDGVMELCLQPGPDYWGPITLRLGRIHVGYLLVGAGPVLAGRAQSVNLLDVRTEGGVARAAWTVETDNGPMEVRSSLELEDRTLVVEWRVQGEGVAGLSLGRLETFAGREELRDPGGSPIREVRVSGVRPFRARSVLEYSTSAAAAPAPASEQGWEAGAIRFVDSTGRERHLVGRITIDPGPEDVASP